MRKAEIAVELDSTIKDHNLFKKIEKLIISKPLIFKYAIFSEDKGDTQNNLT